MVRLSNLQTAGLCRELALLLHAGVSVGDGLSLLAQEESAAALRPVLENMAHYTDEGGPLAGAMREASVFSGICVRIGRSWRAFRSGTEEALQALAGYYDGREQIGSPDSGGIAVSVGADAGHAGSHCRAAQPCAAGIQ